MLPCPCFPLLAVPGKGGFGVRLKHAELGCPWARRPARRGSCFPMGLPVDCFGFLTKGEGKGVGGQGGKGFGRAKTVKIHHTIVRQIFIEVRLPARRALSLSCSLALSRFHSHSAGRTLL